VRKVSEADARASASVNGPGSWHLVGELWRRKRGQLVQGPDRIPDLQFPDGVLLRNLRDAIQAAWLADDRALAKELALRYDIYDLVCLRCATAQISVPAGPSKDPYDYQLCNACLWQTTSGSRSTNPHGEIT
jgi:hypothetical protein